MIVFSRDEAIFSLPREISMKMLSMKSSQMVTKSVDSLDKTSNVAVEISAKTFFTRYLVILEFTSLYGLFKVGIGSFEPSKPL